MRCYHLPLSSTSTLILPPSLYHTIASNDFKRRANSSHMMTQKKTLPLNSNLTPRRLLRLRLLLTRPREHRDGVHLLQTTHRGLRSILPALARLLIDEHRLPERIRASCLGLECSGRLLLCCWLCSCKGIRTGDLCLQGLETCLLLRER